MPWSPPCVADAVRFDLSRHSTVAGVIVPLDPYAKRFLDMVAAGGARDVSRLSPAEMREGFRQLAQTVDARNAPIDRIENGELPGPAGPLPIRIYSPRASAAGRLPGLIYFHGGGGVFGGGGFGGGGKIGFNGGNGL